MRCKLRHELEVLEDAEFCSKDRAVIYELWQIAAFKAEDEFDYCVGEVSRRCYMYLVEAMAYARILLYTANDKCISLYDYVKRTKELPSWKAYIKQGITR